MKNIGTRENEKSIARNLYGVLREFDEENVDTIYSESFAVQGMGTAIMNRLEKAAGHLRISASEVVKLRNTEEYFCERNGFSQRADVRGTSEAL